MGKNSTVYSKKFYTFQKELIWLREEYIHTVVADTI